jgi:putative transcriptional regulator
MAIVRKTLAEIKASRPQVNRAKMYATTETDIQRHMVEDGEDPAHELSGFDLVVPAQHIRKKLAMTQAQFAAALHVPLPTLQNWEQGRVKPDPAARALLMIVDKEPEVALRALKVA